MTNHGINITHQATNVSTPVVAESGIPFVVGLSPIHTAEKAAAPNTPILCTSWDEAVKAFGYSDDWSKYTLCEFMYSHFKLFNCQPVILCNVLDADKTVKASATSTLTVSNHQTVLSSDAVAASLELKTTKEAAPLVKGVDYTTYYTEENLVIELLEGGSAYESKALYCSFNEIDSSKITTTDIATAIESIELCLTKLGVIPDLICVPGYSKDSAVAAAMAAKCCNISGSFRAKPIIDIDCSTTGAKSYSEAITLKGTNNLTDKDEIVCWPMVKMGDKKFHMSTQIAGRIARVDTDNEGCPYESPSNKNLQCDSLVLEDGTEVNLTISQANQLNQNGIVTAINFVNGWVAWGNYTGCYPSNTDVKDCLIPINRMFGWVGNTLIKTFWSKLDKPINRRLIDSILDISNIWLNGLVGRGYLLGAHVEMIESENPIANLMVGKIKLHIHITPPSPSQELDFVLEYDANYVTKAFEN